MLLNLRLQEGGLRLPLHQPDATLLDHHLLLTTTTKSAICCIADVKRGCFVEDSVLDAVSEDLSWRRFRSISAHDFGISHVTAPGRVRVAVRVRPKNAEELSSEADFADCIELQPELKRLILKKNNWSSESYKFDEVFAEAASQKRVYDAVAKPVAESVLNGYNGTVMAYGQTGSGKTYTLGRLGKHDPSERGIMVRALEDILSSISPSADAVAISYLQLYMETIQDLLAPEKSNIQIVEDSKTAEVSLPGSTVIKVRDIDHALQLLEIGESNRHTANTKYNTESSRSHAILLVYVKKSVKGKGETESSTSIKKVDDGDVPTVVKSKLLMVDLAGSERIDKSGGDGHMIEEAKFINLSLTSLGKCINAIAENSPHIPIRDSKLTRLLRDSFGGSARTSLVITIGPSGRHTVETTSTIMFGQRAMKIENVVKLREECDYEALCRKLELQLDFLTAQNEKDKRLRDVEMKEMQNKLKEYEQSLGERGKSLALISESSAREKHTLEEEIAHILSELSVQKERHGMMCKEVESLQLSLRNMRVTRSHGKENTDQFAWGLENHSGKLRSYQSRDTISIQRATMAKIFEEGKPPNTFRTVALLTNISACLMDFYMYSVGLQKILALLRSEDMDVQIHAAKVVANLASEVSNLRKIPDANQEKIVNEGGLDVLLLLLDSQNETIRRVASGAIANLAMNENNQALMMCKGGARLLSNMASKTDDSQTQRMVAGAIANLCGNEKLHAKLKEDGGIKALLEMARSGHKDIIAQVARGFANFAKCESRGGHGHIIEMHITVVENISTGSRNGQSLLIEDGALTWIIANVYCSSASIRRHVELALCHLAQHEENAKSIISGGAITELIRIAHESIREDIRNLAKRALNTNTTLRVEMQRLGSL
ncbi:Armadillo repeat-containing kinesin-like protein 2 [Nymphaea thermarum]|nr:Armadillo repeat-containing kinesin-like protein 2 [Nymphaea thermarum]